MAEPLRHLDHIYVVEHAADAEFHRGGHANPKIRDVERRAHGLQLRGQLDQVFSENANERQGASVSADELRALGTFIVLEGGDAAYPLKVESLNQLTRHRNTPRLPEWLLLSVQPATEGLPERASVWVSDQYRARFLGLFEDYLTKNTPRNGNPKNEALVANIARIRHALLADLWTSEGEPPSQGTHWWELWIDTTQSGMEAFERFVASYGLTSLPRSLRLRDRVVVWVQATWDQLQILPFTSVPVAEVRRPEFVDTVEDLPAEEQDEYAQELAGRVTPAGSLSPVITHLDTGVLQSHILLRDSIDPNDVHTIFGASGGDVRGHGTNMAGLALYGDLDALLASTAPVVLEHQLESVRMMPGPGERGRPPIDFGTATAEAVALPEIAAPGRPRVFCMPISTEPERAGEPTLWSATVDALAVGTDVARDGEQLQLLSSPDPEAARLLLIAAGNVGDYQPDQRTISDTSPVEDPAQAWNALTVSAHTELTDVSSDPSFHGWHPLAGAGELSPHSRTSTMFARHWPIKPDICMEGGNVLTDGATQFHENHPLLSLRTTDSRNDLALGSANATSAATAQAARLAAITMARYPVYWPETVRGLLTHAAEWTPAMRAEVDALTGKTAKLAALRRFGWGVPAEDAVLHSTQQAVTLVTQDRFVPFEGSDYRMRRFRMHTLPWPTEALESLAEATVRLRITLSYFVEPSASRRGWRRRYAYPSHGLRFDLQHPLETTTEFVSRVNHDALQEEDGTQRSASGSDEWLLGPNQRHLGSLHQDDWTGSGRELAASSSIAVYPVGGWWKNGSRPDRVELPVRYALLVSLRTEEQGVDLYTPIVNELRIPTEIVIE